MTNQAIESSTSALTAFSITAPEVGPARASMGANAPIGTDIVAPSTVVKVALEDWPRSLERAKAGHDDGDDQPPNIARNAVVGGQTAIDARFDDRTVPLRSDEDPDRRRRPAEPDFELPGEPEHSDANEGYALHDIVRFAGEIIAIHRDDMRDEPWPLSARS